MLSDFARHANHHITELLRLLGGGELRDFAFVRAHAHCRASQRFPLEAMLHAYRAGHKVLLQWISDAAISAKPRRRQQIFEAVAAFSI
ncbi:MAG: hypothetical protein EXR39_08775 [Betaproteobacteria bacterium]|nr:hypothetical protein [Betaproteobacteria bacterium]